jgi:hypothetical protein
MVDLRSPNLNSSNEARFEEANPNDFACRHSWPPPSNPGPIVVISTGGIVDDALLPAYFKADLPVLGVFEVDGERADAPC